MKPLFIDDENIMEEANLEYRAAKIRLSYTKYLAILALCAWPFGLFHSVLASFFIFAVLMILWGVSTYIAFMHHCTLKNRLEKLDEERRKLQGSSFS